jgi:hypothetical protein
VSARRTVFRRVLILETLAFLVVALIIWLDELLDLPHVLFHAPATPFRLVECGLESALTLLLGILVVGVTARAFRRIEYLESFLVICAWCRRVREGTEWLTLEQFLAREHGAPASHGICEACAATTLATVP